MVRKLPVAMLVVSSSPSGSLAVQHLSVPSPRLCALVTSHWRMMSLVERTDPF